MNEGSASDTPSAVLAVEDLDVAYGNKLVLDHITLAFRAGVHGVLGPNGAGKSTLFKALVGVLEPRGGLVLRDGRSISNRRVRRGHQATLGYLPQDPGWFDGFSVKDLCMYFASLRRVPRTKRTGMVDAAIESVNLGSKKNARLGELSGGQRRRTFIAQALVHAPSILILDEPTSGLDPSQRLNLRELVISLGRDHCVVVSTHLVEDVAHMADTVTILDRGRVAWEGSPSSLASLGEETRSSGTGFASAHELGFLAVVADSG